MAGRIQGITVVIGGDTTKLEKALKGVNSTIRSTQSQLKDINKLLKLDPSNTELLSQKHRVLKDAIGATKEKLDALKTAQEQARQQLENGTLGQDRYDALQREIVETEQELQRLQRESLNTNAALEKIDAVGKTLENVGNSIKDVGQDGAQRHRRYAQHLHPPGTGRCCRRDGQDGGGRGSAERAREAFGRIRTDGVIAEDVQDGMKRRAELITFEGWWASFFYGKI